MSSDAETADAIKRQAAALEQNALVSAAGVAQRQQEAAAAAKVNGVHARDRALNFAFALTAQQAERTAETIVKEAETFLDFLEGRT